MSSDLISIVFQIMHFRANVWDRESFRDKGRKKGRKKRISESIALIFVSILCIPDLWLNHVLSESVSKKSCLSILHLAFLLLSSFALLCFDMYNNTDFTIYIHTHARAQNLVELQKNGSQEKNYRI